VSEPVTQPPAQGDNTASVTLPALAELKAIDHWVGWRWELVDGRRTKVPYIANNGHRGDSTKPSTWRPFGVAAPAYKKAGHEGLGFVVSDLDPYTGIDLDHCRDAETGEIQAWAQTIIGRFNSYTEVTPSQEGVRIWIKGNVPGDRHRKGHIEIYDNVRFFTVTGRHLEGCPRTIESRQDELDDLYTETFGAPAAPKASSSPTLTTLTDAQVLDMARKARNGAKAVRLLAGDTSGYDSPSEAVGGLLWLLAYWTRDVGQLDRLFRGSGLYPLWAEKWERLGGSEIDKALAGVPEQYVGSGGKIPQHGQGDRHDATAPAGSIVRLVTAAGVRPETVTWAWQGRIPVGMLGLLVGEGGLGKSLLGCYLAAGFSRGTIPGDFYGHPVDVAIASSEDHRAAVIVPRLMAAGADLSRVHFVEQVGEEGIAGDIDINGDIDRLEAALLTPRVRFLLIDTVVSHVPSEHDSHKEQHVRRVLAPLARMAERREIAVIGTMHLNRRDGGNVLTRIMGSGGFGNLARSVLVFGRDPQETPDSSNRLLGHGKSNVGPQMPTLRVRVETSETTEGGRIYPTARVEVLEEVPGVYAGDILSVEDVGQEERSARGDAVEFLKEALGDGPRPARDIEGEARDMDISSRTLKRARKELEVRAFRQGISGRQGGGQSVWELPQKSLVGQAALKQEHGPLNNSEYEQPADDADVGPVNPVALGPCEHCGRPAIRAIGRVLTCDESPCKASALRLLAAGVTAR